MIRTFLSESYNKVTCMELKCDPCFDWSSSLQTRRVKTTKTKGSIGEPGMY